MNIMKLQDDCYTWLIKNYPELKAHFVHNTLDERDIQVLLYPKATVFCFGDLKSFHGDWQKAGLDIKYISELKRFADTIRTIMAEHYCLDRL